MKFKTISLAAVAIVAVTFAALRAQSGVISAAAATSAATKQAMPTATKSASLVVTMSATVAATMDAATIAKTTLLRVIHASPNSPHVDVYLDNGKMPAIPDLAYDDATDGYLAIPAGVHQLTITAANDKKTIVFDAKVTFIGGSAITALAEGQLADKTFTVHLFTDDVSSTKGKVRISIIHAIPDAGNVDVVTADFKQTLVDNLPFGSSMTLEVPAGSYDLFVVPHGKKDVVFDLKNTKLVADQIYALVATGKLTGKDAVTIKLLAYASTPVLGFMPPPVATLAATMSPTLAPTMKATAAATLKK